jgi:hypothetical protein
VPRSVAVTMASAIRVRASRSVSSGVPLVGAVSMIGKYSVPASNVVSLEERPVVLLGQETPGQRRGVIDLWCPGVTARAGDYCPVGGPADPSLAHRESVGDAVDDLSDGDGEAGADSDGQDAHHEEIIVRCPVLVLSASAP